MSIPFYYYHNPLVMGSSFGPSYLKLAYLPLLPTFPPPTPASGGFRLVGLDTLSDEEEADVIGEPTFEDESRMDDSIPIDGNRPVEVDGTLDAEDENEEETAATGVRNGFRDCKVTVAAGGWVGPWCSDKGT
jgi:hypothetical protein